MFGINGPQTQYAHPDVGAVQRQGVHLIRLSHRGLAIVQQIAGEDVYRCSVAILGSQRLEQGLEVSRTQAELFHTGYQRVIADLPQGQSHLLPVRPRQAGGNCIPCVQQEGVRHILACLCHKGGCLQVAFLFNMAGKRVLSVYFPKHITCCIDCSGGNGLFWLCGKGSRARQQGPSQQQSKQPGQISMSASHVNHLDFSPF